MNLLAASVFIATLWISTNGVIFDCTYRMFNWVVVGDVYHCYPAKVTLPDESTSVTEIRGLHNFGKTNNDVKGLYIADTNCPFFPSQIEKFFPNLLMIHFAVTNLKSVTKENLRPFPILKYFGVSRNPIEAIDGDIFDNNMELERVNFYQNQMRNVGLNLLDKLAKLQSAQFSGNICIDYEGITPETLAKIKMMLVNQCPALATTTTTQPTTTTQATTTSGPTCGLIEEISVCNAEFSYLIDLQVANRTNPLTLKVFDLDKQQIKTQKQVDDSVERINRLETELGVIKDQLTDVKNNLTKRDKLVQFLENQFKEILRILEAQQKV